MNDFNLYFWIWLGPGAGHIEGMFFASEQEIDSMIGKTARFYEYIFDEYLNENGYIDVEIKREQFTQVFVNAPIFKGWLFANKGRSVSGAYLIDYIIESENNI